MALRRAAAAAAVAAAVLPSAAAQGGVTVVGRQLFVDGCPVHLKGICWNPVALGNTHPQDLDYAGYVARDGGLMRQLGVNAVRPYEPITDTAILDVLWSHGVYVVNSVYSWGGDQVSNVDARVLAVRDHPSILMWSIGNEWNYNQLYRQQAGMTHPQALERVRQVAARVKQLDRRHPITTIYGGLPGEVELSGLPDIDVWGINYYGGKGFGSLFNDFAQRSGKPMFVAEYGADAWNTRTGREDQAAQAVATRELTAQITAHAAATGGECTGGFIFELADEYWKAGGAGTSPWKHDTGGLAPGGGPWPDQVFNEEWWGLVTIDRAAPREAFYAYKEAAMPQTGCVQPTPPSAPPPALRAPPPPAPTPPPSPPSPSKCSVCIAGARCCDPTTSPPQLCLGGAACCNCGTRACLCGSAPPAPSPAPPPSPPAPPVPSPGTAACKRWPGCSTLAGDCCPNAGVWLSCCCGRGAAEPCAAAPPPAPPAPASVGCEPGDAVWHTPAGGDGTCGDRIVWCEANLAMSRARAKARVAGEFPHQCGACAAAHTPANHYRKVSGVGGWGGWCRCPDGQRYNVGDRFDGCASGPASLACEGGMPGECVKAVDAARDGMKVTCAAGGAWQPAAQRGGADRFALGPKEVRLTAAAAVAAVACVATAAFVARRRRAGVAELAQSVGTLSAPHGVGEQMGTTLPRHDYADQAAAEAEHGKSACADDKPRATVVGPVVDV